MRLPSVSAKHHYHFQRHRKLKIDNYHLHQIILLYSSGLFMELKAESNFLPDLISLFGREQIKHSQNGNLLLAKVPWLAQTAWFSTWLH